LSECQIWQNPTFFEEYYLTCHWISCAHVFYPHCTPSGSMSTGTAYLRKQTNLCFNVMQTLGIWRGSSGGVKILSSKVPYLKSPTHILVFTLKLSRAASIDKSRCPKSAIIAHFSFSQ